MFRRLGKKGDESKLMFLMWEVIVLAIVVIALIVAVRSVANNSSFWKKYYSYDLAMITELEHTNQGDFIINYQLKEYSGIAKSLGLVSDQSYDISLLKGVVEVYQSPKDDDKFPTKFLYGISKDINVIESTIMSNFFTISKIGNELRFKESYGRDKDVCPSISTSANISELRFTIISTNPKVDSYTTYLDGLLKNYGIGSNHSNELLIVFTYTNITNTTIYYSDKQISKASKLGCMIRKNLIATYPDKDITLLKYEGLLDGVQEFSTNRQTNNYFIIIALSDTDFSVSNKDFNSIVKETIKDYYS